MATSVAETHQWSLCNKIIHINPSAFGDPFNKFYASNQCTEHGTYQTQITLRTITDEVPKFMDFNETSYKYCH